MPAVIDRIALSVLSSLLPAVLLAIVADITFLVFLTGVFAVVLTAITPSFLLI
jgi:hypothetical protein